MEKNSLTPAGIEPATFRFVAQHLNHWATAVSYTYLGRVNFLWMSAVKYTYTFFILSQYVTRNTNLIQWQLAVVVGYMHSVSGRRGTGHILSAVSCVTAVWVTIHTDMEAWRLIRGKSLPFILILGFRASQYKIK